MGRKIDTPDPRKAREAARARDLARAELVRLYREANRAHALDKFQSGARFFIENLIQANGGEFPKLRLPPGRPRKQHEMMVVHLAVLEELDALGPRDGNKTKAIKAVADRYHKRPQDVRDITYNRHAEWQEAVGLSIALRQVWSEADQPGIKPPTIEGQEIIPEQFKEYSTLVAAECPTGMTLADSLELWS